MKQMTMLVVDADQAFRESVANLLLLCGVEKFEVVASAEEAKNKISGAFFDFILIDLFLPQMTGLHLAQEFQKRMPQTKIILVIDDKQQSMLNRVGEAKLNFPTILKSFVSHTLPQLLSEESESMY
jgi:DNA-binding NtrC family response regulator